MQLNLFITSQWQRSSDPANFCCHFFDFLTGGFLELADYYRGTSPSTVDGVAPTPAQPPPQSWGLTAFVAAAVYMLASLHLHGIFRRCAMHPFLGTYFPMPALDD